MIEKGKGKDSVCVDVEGELFVGARDDAIQEEGCGRVETDPLSGRWISSLSFLLICRAGGKWLPRVVVSRVGLLVARFGSWRQRIDGCMQVLRPTRFALY